MQGCQCLRVFQQKRKPALFDSPVASADAGIELSSSPGTNLAFAEVAAMAEFWLEKPVIAINTATYWHALRSMGLNDQMDGFGALLRRF